MTFLHPVSRELVMDEEQKLPHDVLLTKVDVQHAPYGLYNFYKLQVVRQTVKDLYVLFNKWGRIGDEGQYQRTPFKNKEEAVKEFCKIFKAKTGNDWNKLDRCVQRLRLLHHVFICLVSFDLYCIDQQNFVIIALFGHH